MLAHVRRSECGVSPSGSGSMSCLASAAVGLLDGWGEHALADVRRAGLLSGPRGEDEGAGIARLAPGRVREQLVTQQRQQRDGTGGGVGLGAGHLQASACEVDVPPTQAQALVNAKAAEHEHGEQSAAVGPRAVVAVSVERASPVQQSGDVLGPVQVGPPRLDGGEAPTLASGDVALDVAVLVCLLQDRRERAQRLVMLVVPILASRTFARR